MTSNAVFVKPSTVSILTVTVLWLTICFCWIETSANVLTEWLDFELGLYELYVEKKLIQHFEM